MPRFHHAVRAVALAYGLACCVAIGAIAQLPDWMPRPTSNGQPLDASVYPHPGFYAPGVAALAYNADGSLIALAVRNGAIAVVETDSGKTRAAWPAGVVTSLDFAADGSLVSGGRGIQSWDAGSGKLLRTLNATGTAVAASPDGKVLAGVDQGSVHLWDAAGNKLRTLKVGKKAGTLAFSPDSRFLAAVEMGKVDQIKLFDVETGKSVRTVGQSADIRALAFSPDGLLLASADKIWEVSTGRQVRSLVQRSYGGVAFSPDGRWMISEGSEGIPVLREVATGKETYPLAGHKASIQNVAVTFHPGGKIAATGGWDNTVRFWDVETGRELGVVPVPHIWEVSRAELETCVSKPATNSSEPARVRCTVWATLRNASGLKAWLPSKHYMIYLYEGPKKKSSLSDLTWNGQRESIDAEYSMERYRYAALEPGESGEFTLSFDLPENIDRRKLSLVVLDGPPAEVAEASGSRPVSTSAAVASRPSSSSGSKDSFSFTTDRTGKLVAVNNEPVGSGAGAAPAKNSREWEDLARRVVQLHEQAKFSEALPVAERALKVAEQTFGPEDTKVATSLNSLASIYDSLKKFDAALPLAKRAVALQEKLLGPEHADVGNALNTLGMIYSGQEKFVEAEETFEHAIAITEKAKGPKDEQLGLIYNNLGKAYSEQDKYSEAEAAYERSLDILEEKVGPWDQRLAAALNNLAYVRKQKRDYDGALMLYERSLGVLERGVGENHPYVAVVLENLAALYKLKGWTKEAQEASARAQRIKSNR